MGNELNTEGKIGELEFLEFTLNENHYGINVARIREILQYQEVTPVPNASSAIEGIFMPRDVVMTIVNLKRNFSMKENDEKGIFIITSINGVDIAFHVDKVVGIQRIVMSEIIEPDATVNTDESGVTKGVVKLDDRLIVLLDFEKIVASVNPEAALKKVV